MYKLGRGNGKRPVATPPASSGLRRPPSAGPRGRLSIGGSAAPNRPTASASAPREENFSLESEGPLNFAAIVKLTPDLVEEIRRVESEGGFARIKFDPSLKNQTRNVIDVGGKEFKFTWSKDSGNLCEIYEERQSKEDEKGSLVECGSSWRKLNVHRNLDESMKNHVKMGYEEAQRLSQSRKPIVLDPTNPSVKNKSNSKAADAVEGSMRKMGWKNKQEFFKKQKVESNHASNIGQPKSASNSGNTIKKSKVRSSVSPNLTPEQNPPGTSTSPFGFVNAEKNITSCHVVGIGEEIEKLRSMLISILLVNPNGMSLKDLEKVIGESIPTRGRKIPSILKEVAVSGASGTYVLKSHLRQTSEFGSSPECFSDHAALAETAQAEIMTNLKFQHQSFSSLNLGEETDCSEKINMTQDNEKPFAIEGKINNDGKDRADNSSGSDSDSYSDNSDSGSGSRSTSSVRGDSASSSDSDSDTDGSSSSKKGSDIDVDILSDSEKDTVASKAVVPVPNLSPFRSLSEYAHEQNNFSIEQHIDVSSSPINLNSSQYDEGTKVVETNKELRVGRENFAFENHETKTSNNGMMDVYNKNSRVRKAASLRSPNQERQAQSQPFYHNYSAYNVNEQIQGSSFSDNHSMLKDRSVQVLQENSGRKSKPKFKRPSSSNHFKPGGNKRPKSTSSAHNLFDENKEQSSLGKTQANVTDRYELDSSQDNDLQTSGNLGLDKVVRTDSWDTSQAMHVRNTGSEIPHEMQRSPFFQSGPGLDVKQSAHGSGDFDKWEKDLENTDRLNDSYRREYGDLGRMSVDNELQCAKKKSDVEKIPLSVAKGSILRRELSDLELGELCETSGVEECEGNNRPMGRKGSFRTLQATIPPNLDLDISKGRGTANPPSVPRKQSPGNHRNHLNQRKQPKDIFFGAETTAHTQVKPLVSVDEHFANVDHVGSVSLLDIVKPTGKCRNVGKSSQGVILENGGTQKKISAEMLPQYKARPSNLQRDSTGRDMSEVSLVNNIDHVRGSAPPSDEDNSLYLKYDKDKPELKGAIKDFSQYKEYVDECREKYEVYYSLNINLVTIRNKFLQVGSVLEIAKGRNMDEYLRTVEKLKTMYQQCSEKNKKMRRVFILLHDELKNLKQRIKDFANPCTN